MSATYRVQIHRREDATPSVSLTIAFECEIAVPPELREAFTHAMAAIKEGRQDGLIDNPFTGERETLAVDELSTALLGALDLAEQPVAVPLGASIDFGQQVFAKEMNLTTLLALDAGLRRMTTVRVEGTAPNFVLVLDSGLKKRERPIATIPDAENVAAAYGELAINFSDANSGAFVADQVERDAAVQTARDLQAKSQCIRDAIDQWNRDLENRSFKEAQDRLNGRVDKCREPVTRNDGDGGGFRAGKGFVS